MISRVPQTPVIIIGAGLGGLTTALSLFAAGIECKLFEAAPRIEAQGFSINLQPVAVRELAELGLSERLGEIASPIERLAFYNRHGQLVFGEPRGLACGFRWPQYGVGRGTLQALLYEHALARMGPDRILAGLTLVEFEQNDSGVVARFAASTDGAVMHSERADVLVGADGLHSMVRRQHYPERALRFAGQLMWRSRVTGPPFLNGKTMFIAGHRNQKFVAYPTAPSCGESVLINWMAGLGQSGDAPPREDWSRRVDKSLFADRFSGWKFDWLDIPALIDSAEAITEFPMMDRDPVPRWTFGRVTLLGDAAHPMQPVGSQAGSQAIVDARCLAWHMSRSRADLPAALIQYEHERLPQMHAVVLNNRAMGAEVMMDIAEERAPDGFADIDNVIPRAEREQRAAAYRQLAGLDVHSVNAGTPYSIS